jgi:hypothetical protein
MKLLQTNRRKNRIIKALKNEIKIHKFLLKKQERIIDDRDERRERFWLDEISSTKIKLNKLEQENNILKQENEKLLEYKGKYYNLIKNLK